MPPCHSPAPVQSKRPSLTLDICLQDGVGHSLRSSLTLLPAPSSCNAQPLSFLWSCQICLFPSLCSALPSPGLPIPQSLSSPHVCWGLCWCPWIKSRPPWHHPFCLALSLSSTVYFLPFFFAYCLPFYSPYEGKNFHVHHCIPQAEKVLHEE